MPNAGPSTEETSGMNEGVKRKVWRRRLDLNSVMLTCLASTDFECGKETSELCLGCKYLRVERIRCALKETTRKKLKKYLEGEKLANGSIWDDQVVRAIGYGALIMFSVFGLLIAGPALLVLGAKIVQLAAGVLDFFTSLL